MTDPIDALRRALIVLPPPADFAGYADGVAAALAAEGLSINTSVLREAAQAVCDKAELDDSGFDGECVDYLVPIPTLDDLRAALAADTRPVGRNVQDVQDARPGLRIAVCPHCGEELSVAAEARPGLDVEALARALEPFTRSVLHDDIGKWRRETAAKIVTEYARLTEDRP